MRWLHMCPVKLAVLFCGASAALHAQLPAIHLHGVVNSASFLAPGLPAGSIAQGSIFTIFGSALGPAAGVQVSSFPLGNTLSGVSITVTQGSTVVNAIPLYVRQDQINALMPSNAPLGWVSVRVTHNNAFSNPSPVYVVHDSPGIYTSTGSGGGEAAVSNVETNGTLTPNSNKASAKPGQTVQMFLTGLGPITTPDNQAPPANSPTTPVEVWVGGISATVTYSGRSPCCSGLDQFDFVIPNNAPTGCWVPIQIRTTKANLSNGVSMAIAAKGGACGDPENPLTSGIVNGGAIGELWLTRSAVHQDVGLTNPIDIIGDTLDYIAQKQPGGPFVSPPMLAAPPPGTCALYGGIGDYWGTGKLADATSFTALDAGSAFTVNGPGGKQTVSLAFNTAPLGSQMPIWQQPNTLYLAPGNYTVSGTGGADVGGINVSIPVAAPLTWTNRDQTTNVSRSQPLTVSWSGAPSGHGVAILGENSDLRTNSSAVFYCVAPAGATSFTIPPQVLAFIPPSRPNPLDSTGIIFVISSSSVSLSAKGLDVGLASSTYKTGKTVVFQ
ncbi:MAG TPA: hypothetical protein VKT81_19685 [Bryobacteraceae bacterium]|nr:hypothetical protein [Bryobacteraceae bacterium]